MKLTKFLAIRTAGKLVLLDPATHMEKGVLAKSGATTFAINPNDQMAVAFGKKIQLFHLDLKSTKYLPLPVNKKNELTIPDTISKMSKPRSDR
jgi:hypothetical protein